MNNLNKIFSVIHQKAAMLILMGIMGMFTHTYAADSTLFRIVALQDTVDAGDTIDVDLFIGDAGHLADSITEFEIEIEYDLDICDKNKMDFKLDTTSMTAFFGTSFTDISTLNTSMGRINVKVNCNSNGKGIGHIGRGRFIVQDNVAGLNLLHFDFSKLTAKRVKSGGNDKPVSYKLDSTWVIKGYHQVATLTRNNTSEKIRIFPNPVSDYLQIEGLPIHQYQLLGPNGNIILSLENSYPNQPVLIDTKQLSAGEYVLMINTGIEWKSYRVIKE